jgi:hypothetical protein
MSGECHYARLGFLGRTTRAIDSESQITVAALDHLQKCRRAAAAGGAAKNAIPQFRDYARYPFTIERLRNHDADIAISMSVAKTQKPRMPETKQDRPLNLSGAKEIFLAIPAYLPRTANKPDEGRAKY